MMLANRLSPTTTRRRPTLNPSSNHKNKNSNQIELRCLQSNCSKPIRTRRRQIRSKTCDLQNEYDDGNTRPPPSSIGSNLSTNSLIPSSFNSSPSVLTTIKLDHNGQSSNYRNEAFSSNCLSTASTNNHKANKRLRLVHSTTR